METLQKKVTVDITPEDCAFIFCSMDGNQMAEFFNQIALEVRGWDNPFDIQMQFVADSSTLTTEARHIMNVIGQYSSAMPVAPEPEVAIEVGPWNHDTVLEVINRINGLCGPTEVLRDLSKMHTHEPITEEQVINAIHNNEPF